MRTRKTQLRAWLAMTLSIIAIGSRAGDPVFDGSKGPSPAIESASIPPARNVHIVQSGKDLFYFTEQEALEADAHFKKFPPVPRKDRGYTFDADVPPAIQKQMREDLAFIDGITGGGATPLHQKIFGTVNGPAYTKFFVDRVTGIGMDDCGSSNAVACVMPFMNPSKMWLTENFIKFSHPQIARMMVVFHEARHTERNNRNWFHAYCPTPFLDANGRDIRSIWTGSSLAGEPACDVTPFGSYGSSTIMLKNISKFCTNCTDKVKMDASLYAEDQMGRIVDPKAKKDMDADLKP
ncbi:MAG: hypothetical protein AAB036_03445 [Elusimicrobiota bacterium]